MGVFAVLSMMIPLVPPFSGKTLDTVEGNVNGAAVGTEKAMMQPPDKHPRALPEPVRLKKTRSEFEVGLISVTGEHVARPVPLESCRKLPSLLLFMTPAALKPMRL